MFFPGRGGLVSQIHYNDSIDPHIVTDPLAENSLSRYSSGHYAFRVPETVMEDTSPLHDVTGDEVYLSMSQTPDDDLVVRIECDADAASPDSQAVKANPSMVYSQDEELGFLFPIPVGDILFPGEADVEWYREGTTVYGVLHFDD